MLFSRVQISNPDTGDADSGDVVYPCFLVLFLNPLSLLILSLPLLSLLQNMLPESSAYLENTLQFHSSFKEAAVGLRTVKCVLVLKKHDMFDVATVAEGGVR